MYVQEPHTLPLDRLLAAQNRALELAVGGASLGDVLGTLALALEDVADRGTVAAVSLLDRDGLHLRHAAAPSLPATYTRALDGIAVGAKAACCGTAAFTRRRVIAEDIATDPSWDDYRAAALAHGLRSCWSTPIVSPQGGGVVGTFACYAPEPRRPTDAEQDTVDRLARTAALAIDRERALAVLGAEHERHRLVAEAAHDAIWDWNVASNDVMWSQGLRSRFGHEPLDASADPHWWSSRIHPADAERVHASFHDALERGDDSWEDEYRFARGDGSYADVLDRGHVVRDGPGRPVRVVGAMIDVTERRAAQARDRFLVQLDDALRPLGDPGDIAQRAAALLGEFLQARRCTYAEVRDDGTRLAAAACNGADDADGEAGRAALAAECVRQVLGGEPFVVTDSDTDPRVAGEVRGACRAAGVRALVCVPVVESGCCVAALTAHMCSPRSWRAHEVELVQRVAARCREALERVRLTQRLQAALDREQRAREDAEQQRQLAESANRAKDEFLAMLGHELRNPLSPIRTALQLMKLRGTDTVERERTVIERQVGHLTRLVDDLLDVSRIARGKVELRFEEVPITDVVARAVELASPLLEERGHHLTIDLPADPVTVTGDPTRLGQVLSNLLTNAAKYTDHGGAITVSAARDGEDVVLSVADTGVGIAPDTLPRVFDLFVQERQGSDRALGGLGLGLAIVRNLVERHGGSIEARSPGLGQGSVFSVRLPMKGLPTTATGGWQPDVPDVTVAVRRRVLVVDDNEDGAAMLAEVLAARGHEVAVAHDAPAALDAAQAFQPEIALLDIGLPVMDGYELAVKLRQLPGLAQVTLVAVTGYGQPTDKARSRAAGFNEHLVKPVDLAVLDRVVR